MGTERAYIRLRTKSDNEEALIKAMLVLGIDKSNIYLDGMSGKVFRRPMYNKMLSELQPGDTVYVKSIDDLGKSYKDIAAQWKKITQDKKSDIVIMDMPVIDTRKNKEQIGNLIYDVVYALLDHIGKNEHRLKAERQAEGIVKAKENGVKFGAPRHPETDTFKMAVNLWRDGYLSLRKAADLCDLSKSTFYDMAKRYENGE